MGANDAAEMLEVAKAECLRLERENTALRAERTPAEVEARIGREAVREAAQWLDGLREETWNAGFRRVNNYHRAAEDLRRYANGVR